MKFTHIASLAFCCFFLSTPNVLAAPPSSNTTTSSTQINNAVPDVLVKSRARLRHLMGINPEMKEAPVEAITLSIYPGSLMVVHKYHGINFDDLDQTLPFATFITTDQVDDVIAFFHKKLPYYKTIKNGTATVFVQEISRQGDKYPESYLKIPNISVDTTTLTNGKTGTLIAEMYIKSVD